MRLAIRMKYIVFSRGKRYLVSFFQACDSAAAAKTEQASGLPLATGMVANPRLAGRLSGYSSPPRFRLNRVGKEKVCDDRRGRAAKGGC